MTSSDVAFWAKDGIAAFSQPNYRLGENGSLVPVTQYDLRPSETTFPDHEAILDWNDAGRVLASRIARHPLVTTRFRCPTGKFFVAAMGHLNR